MIIREIAQQYIDEGWAVVPLVAGEKRAESAWNRRVYSADDFSAEDGIAGKCGEPSGWRVDTDADCPEALLALAHLMPKTGLVHGRVSKPDSHLWYIVKDAKTASFTDIKDAGSKTLIEIRSTGGYTALPPSLNPSGEKLEWSHRREPMVLDWSVYYDAVRDAALATLFGRHWPSGSRHHFSGPLAGLLVSGGIVPARVLEIIRASALIAKDEELEDRLKYARATLGKFTKGEKVTGGPTLAEFVGEAVVTKARAWLRLADADSLEIMNQRHFWVRLGKHDCIGREDTADGQPVFQKPSALYSEYANQDVQVGVDKEGQAKFSPLFQTWLESKNRRSYREVVFSPPPHTAAEVDYNLWRGYALQPQKGECSLFLEHLYEVICSRNDEHYRYLTKLMAMTVQRPGDRLEVAVTMRGERGCGKGTVMRVMEDIFGVHFVQVDRVEDLVKFNALISGKVVVFADEAFWAGDKREEGVLKRIITEPTVRITRKGIDSTPERNCMHLFMATNNEWAVPAGVGERRFFSLEVSSKRQDDRAYFRKLYEEIRSGGSAAFLHEMLTVPVSMEEVRSVPRTAELRVQQMQTLPVELQWWTECLWHGCIGNYAPWPEFLPSLAIYENYEAWARKHGGRLLTHIEFSRRMIQYVATEPPRNRRVSGDVIKTWTIRTLSEARKYLDAKFKTVAEWPDPSDPVQSTAPF